MNRPILMNPARAARLIRDDGLFSLLFDDMKRAAAAEDLSVSQLAEMLDRGGQHLDEYLRLCRDNDLSTIDIVAPENDATDSEEISRAKASLAESLSAAKALERFALPCRHGLMAMWTGFAGVLVIFLAHNVFAIWTEAYSTAPALVYGTFFAIIALTVLVHLRIVKSRNRQHSTFIAALQDTESSVRRGLEEGWLSEGEIFRV